MEFLRKKFRNAIRDRERSHFARLSRSSIIVIARAVRLSPPHRGAYERILDALRVLSGYPRRDSRGNGVGKTGWSPRGSTAKNACERGGKVVEDGRGGGGGGWKRRNKTTPRASARYIYLYSRADIDERRARTYIYTYVYRTCACVSTCALAFLPRLLFNAFMPTAEELSGISRRKSGTLCLRRLTFLLCHPVS